MATGILLQPTLVLNAAFLPISIIRAFQALCLVVMDKADIVEGIEGEPIRSQKLSFPLPRVIRLLTYTGVPTNVSWSRLKVLYRDDQTCVWCGKREKVEKLDCDHIIPKSRWFACPPEVRRRYEMPTAKLPNPLAPWNSWLNTAAACRPCNARKGSRFYWKIGMNLRWAPYEPKYVPSVVVSFERAKRLGWTDYLLTGKGKPVLPSAVKIVPAPEPSRAI